MRTLRPLNPQEKKDIEKQNTRSGCEGEKWGYTFAVAQNWAKSATRRLRSSTNENTYQQQMGQFPNITASDVSENEGSA